ncbi:MAG: helix-turn-helix domain-containing protein [Firmicutes bacterium]|nr:helix-turn-helix domain-containing protein [Bacillota bacterium]
MISYAKLWMLLEKKGLMKKDLKEILSTVTIAKLGKNETVTTETIEKICDFLKCQPGDIMEYISEENIQETARQIDMANRALMETLKAKGITEEQFAGLMQQAMPNIIKSMYNGENTMENIFLAGKELKDDEE